jgi:hypothetical protein
VIVRENAEGQVEVASIDPVASMEKTGNAALAATAQEVRARLSNALAAMTGKPHRVLPFSSTGVSFA